MLTLIQSGMEITDSSPEEQGLGYELKLLDALAAIIVRQHEIAAVIAKPDDGSGAIQVLASTTHLDTRNRELTVPQSPGNFINTWWNFLITPNPRNPAKNPHSLLDLLTTNRQNTTSVNPESQVPSHLRASEKAQLFSTFLEYDWLVQFNNLMPALMSCIYRGKETFDTHVWMVNKLLE